MAEKTAEKAKEQSGSKLELYEGSNDRWGYRVVGPDGQVTVDADSAFISKDAAEAAAKAQFPQLSVD